MRNQLVIKSSLPISIIRLNTNDTKLKFNTVVHFDKFIFLMYALRAYISPYRR